MERNEVYNEKEVLQQLSLGSEQAFEQVYHYYSSSLYHQLLKIVKSDVVTQEILQDVFLVLWCNRARINSEKSFRSFIFCIAANKCYDYFRKAARDKKIYAQLVTLSREVAEAATDHCEMENSGILYQVIELLPPKRRLIYQLCKIQGKTYQQVSLQLGISASTISDHIVKANQFIREHLLKTIS